MKVKAYTDLEQSKKLAKILKIETADMRFCFSHTLGGRIIGHYPMIGREPSMGTIPCWSLSALLNVLPKEQHPKLMMNAHYNWICDIINPSSFVYKPTAGDNPLDAVFEMIIQLHELKML